MKDTGAELTVSILNKLARRELELAGVPITDDFRNLKESPSIRFHAYLYARERIRMALARSVDESDAENPFLPPRDELVMQGTHRCDLCGRRCSSLVYSVSLVYGAQIKTVDEVCADCMWRLKFDPVRTVSLDSYRLYEQWLLSQSKADE